jgi:hypothetical protein
MGLETATYINGLVSTNPTAGDPVSQGDDHVRLIKAAVLATFPNITGAVTATHTALNNAATRLLASGTAVASTSGTSIDFTSIPSWVTRVTINLAGVSVSSTSNPLIQIGDAGGIETSGYLGSGTSAGNGQPAAVASYTTGFGLNSATAGNLFHGSIVLTLLDASTNTWACNGNIATSNVAGFLLTAGTKPLSATLDRVRITTVGGADTFDAGTINIMYE